MRSRQDDRIDGRVRRGAVAAFAVHDDVHRIDVGQCHALRVADGAVRLIAGAVQSQAVIGFGETS